MNRAAFDYGGHRVLVTGGTSGIGNSIACAFRDAGAAVTVTGTRPSAAPYDTDLAGMAYRQLQMTDRDAVQALGESFDVLDVLINNAGTGRVDEWEPEGFEATVGVNLFGPFRLTMACYPALKASTAAGGSSVIFVMSMASFQAIPIVPGYGSSKAGMLQLNRNLAVQWSCDGIRVNGIAPGAHRDADDVHGERRPRVWRERAVAHPHGPLRIGRRCRPGRALPVQRAGRVHHGPDHADRRRPPRMVTSRPNHP
jgi:3-oxoacyl-[acyl-carrier protein] reductase